MLGTMTPTPLVLTPRQVAERLGMRLPTLRKHAAALEAVTGEPLPRGEHLERLWPEPLADLLGEALSMVHRQEARSVAEALGALYRPATPPPAPLPDTAEGLRALIREEVRAVVREEVGAALASMSPPQLPAPPGGDGVRLVVREEVRAALDPERLRLLLHAAAPAPAAPTRTRRGLLAQLWVALLSG